MGVDIYARAAFGLYMRQARGYTIIVSGIYKKGGPHMKMLKFVFIAAMFALVAAVAGAQGPGAFSRPGIITSIGQNSDAAIVKVLLNNKLKMELEYGLVVKAAELGNTQTIIMVVGASSKGLGAAGINMDQEIARTEELLAFARQKGIKVILMHTGGTNRRGAASNQLIDVVIKDADAVIVVAAGNQDKYFDKAAKKPGVVVTETATIAEAGAAVQKLFKN